MGFRKKPRLGVVTWLDTHSSDPWAAIPTKYEELVVKSVGYIREFKHGVLVIPNKSDPSEIHEEEGCYGTSHIPRGCIRSIVYLEE